METKDVEDIEEVWEGAEYEEPDRRSEIIASCLNAISAAEYYDSGLESAGDIKRIKDIRKMSLKLIHYYITEMYNEHFEDED